MRARGVVLLKVTTLKTIPITQHLALRGINEVWIVAEWNDMGDIERLLLFVFPFSFVLYRHTARTQITLPYLLNEVRVLFLYSTRTENTFVNAEVVATSK